jgi:thiamine biosynthesis lipoprotein
MTGEIIFRHAEPVMGTVVSFDIRPRGLPYEQTRTALANACRVLHRADKVFSLYRPETPLSRLRRDELTVADCPPEVASVLALCEQAREQSDGWFDPWAISDAVDPTGLVKGWAAQRAADVLRDAGLAGGMVNAAGDIAVFGRPTPTRRWRVGIRSPHASGEVMCVVDAAGAVATSGSYEHGEHVRDPRTGGPATAALSATVSGPELVFADAFATGLLAGGENGFDAVRHAGYEALLVLPDGTRKHTVAFPLAERR